MSAGGSPRGDAVSRQPDSDVGETTMTDEPNSISRRNVLAGLGTIGVGGALVGAGTSAFFSDRETLDGNELVAGELDLRLDWQQLYYGMPEDHDLAPYGSAGRPFVSAHPDHDDNGGNGEQSLNSDEFDSVPDDGVVRYSDESANIQDYLTCETLPNFDDPEDFGNNNENYDPDSLIDLNDIKPGDCGEVTFSLHLCDNPGYIWLFGELAKEIDGLLADAINAKIWYDLDCNNVFDEERDKLIFEWGSLADVFASLADGVQLDPAAYETDTDSNGTDSSGEANGCVKVGKVDVADGGGFDDEVDGGERIDDGVFTFDEEDSAPGWSGDDYLARDVEIKVEFTEFKDGDVSEPVAFTAEVVDGEYGLCEIRVRGGNDKECFTLGDGDVSCFSETEIITNLQAGKSQNGQRAAISNIEFFVCDLPDDEPPTDPCFPAKETFCLGFKWCFPADVDAEKIDGIDDINDLQGTSVGFDLGFYTEQCRHNEEPEPDWNYDN